MDKENAARSTKKKLKNTEEALEWMILLNSFSKRPYFSAFYEHHNNGASLINSH